MERDPALRSPEFDKSCRSHPDFDGCCEFAILIAYRTHPSREVTIIDEKINPQETIIDIIRRVRALLDTSDTIEVAPQLLTLPECCGEEQLHAAVAYHLVHQCADWGIRVEYLMAYDRDNHLVHAAYMPSASRYFDLHGIHNLAGLLERLEVKSDLRIERHSRDTELQRHIQNMDPKCLDAARSALLATVGALEVAAQRMPSEGAVEDALG